MLWFPDCYASKYGFFCFDSAFFVWKSKHLYSRFNVHTKNPEIEASKSGFGSIKIQISKQSRYPSNPDIQASGYRSMKFCPSKSRYPKTEVIRIVLFTRTCYYREFCTSTDMNRKLELRPGEARISLLTVFTLSRVRQRERKSSLFVYKINYTISEGGFENQKDPPWIRGVIQSSC